VSLGNFRHFGKLSFSKIGLTLPLSRKLGKLSRSKFRARSDEDTLRLVIEAAAQEFPANGYAATSMGAVAQRAGVSTKTLYRLIPAKQDLFGLVVTDRIGRFMLAIDDEAMRALDLTEALERILIAYGKLTLAEETIALTRLVIGEGDRFPEIAASFYERAIVRTNVAIVAWLRRQCELGLIRLDDPEAASGMLRGMMIQEPQRAAMLGQRPAPGGDEIGARARACAWLFLCGCRVRRARCAAARRAGGLTGARRNALLSVVLDSLNARPECRSRCGARGTA
jgi:AcrR family transcriptional regulator